MARETPNEIEVVDTFGTRVLLTRIGGASVQAVVAQAVPTSSTMQREGGDVESKLMQLKRLKDTGVLTEEEFAKKKAALLEEL